MSYVLIMTVYPTRREENLIAGYDNGKVNALKMLEDSFGGQLPKELDIVNPPSYDITLQGTFSDPTFYGSTFLGALKGNWGKMGIAYFLFHAPLVAAGIYAASVAARMLGTGGYVRPTAAPDIITINDLWAAVRHIDKAHGGLADVIAHESSHLLQAHDDRISLSSALGDNRTPLKMLFNSKSSRIAYLSSEFEMQARMFTVLTNAYIQHGRMPLTRYELWAALASQGVTPPDGILRQAQTNPELAKAFRDFPASQDYIDKYGDKMGKSDLNKVNESASDNEAQAKLWNKVYPFLYGDLLEIMGDRLGMVRMGHSHNVQLREMFMKAARDHMSGELKADDAQAQMKKVARMMRPQDAMSLMTNIVRGMPYKEHAKESILIPRGGLRAISAFTLASHPGIDPNTAGRAFLTLTGETPNEWLAQMADAERLGKSRIVPNIKQAMRKQRITRANDDVMAYKGLPFPV